MNESHPNVTDASSAPRPTTATPRSCSWITKTSDYRDTNWLANNRFYMQLTIALVGLVIVFSVYGKRMLKGSPYYYICVLSLADTSYVLMDTIIHKLQFGITGYDWQDLGCGFLDYMYHTTQMFAVGTLVFMMFERMLLTLNPIRFQNTFTVKRSAIALGVLAVCVCGMNVPYIWTGRSQRYYLSKYKKYFWACGYAKELESHILPPFYIKMYGFFFLPMVIVFICSVITTVKIVRIAKSGPDVETGGRGQGQQQKGQGLLHKSQGHLKDITTQVLTVSICYIVLTLPYAVAFVPKSPVGKHGEYCAAQLFRYVFTEASKFLYHLQHCLNGYLYCLSSGVFRRQLVEVWRCKKKKAEGYVVSETNLTEMPSPSATVYGLGTTANGAHK